MPLPGPAENVRETQEVERLRLAFPTLLARTPTAASFPKPSDAVNVVTRGSRKLSIPFVVAAHRIPSRSSKRSNTESLDNPSFRPCGPQHCRGCGRYLACGGDPKIAVPIEDRGMDLHFASIEGGSHKWFDPPFLQLSESQAFPFCKYADPERSIWTKSEAHYPVLSCVGFQCFDRVHV